MYFVSLQFVGESCSVVGKSVKSSGPREPTDCMSGGFDGGGGRGGGISPHPLLKYTSLRDTIGDTEGWLRKRGLRLKKSAL